MAHSNMLNIEAILISHDWLQLHSSVEFQDIIEQNPGRLVVLMCKAQGCRPCKMFSRKFQRLAEQFQDAIFLDIMGDETKDTRVRQETSSSGIMDCCGK